MHHAQVCLRALFALALLLPVASASALELTNRQVKMGKDLTMNAASKIAGDLFKLDAVSDEPILLMISTRAGYAPAAMVIADAIAAVKSEVYAVIQSEAFGVGAVVASFCDRRYAFPHASVLFSKLEYDKAKVMKDSPPLPIEAADAYIARVWLAVGKRLGRDGEALQKLADKRWYLDAGAARKEGIVTEIVTNVAWVDLVVETVEVKRTAVVKRQRPMPEAQ